ERVPHHAVPDFGREADERPSQPCDPDGNVGAEGRRWRLKLAEIVLVVFAFEAGELAGVRLGDNQPDELDDLPQMLERLAVWHSEEAFAPRADAAAQTECEAPTADPVEVDRRHRRLERTPRERQCDPRGKLHPRGDGCG